MAGNTTWSRHSLWGKSSEWLDHKKTLRTALNAFKTHFRSDHSNHIQRWSNVSWATVMTTHFMTSSAWEEVHYHSCTNCVILTATQTFCTSHMDIIKLEASLTTGDTIWRQCGDKETQIVLRGRCWSLELELGVDIHYMSEVTIGMTWLMICFLLQSVLTTRIMHPVGAGHNTFWEWWETCENYFWDSRGNFGERGIRSKLQFVRIYLFFHR